MFWLYVRHVDSHHRMSAFSGIPGFHFKGMERESRSMRWDLEGLSCFNSFPKLVRVLSDLLQWFVSDSHFS